MDQKLRDEVGLFRMCLVGDLAVAGLAPGELARLLREKASKVYSIPGSRRTRVAESTLRDWRRKYLSGGLEALKPPMRCDTGRCRTIPQALVDRIVSLREEDGSRSVETILRMLVLAGVLPAGERLPPATVYRALHSRGLSGRRPPNRPGPDRRAFAYERPNQMWQADVMHGPRIPDEKTGKMRKTYLITLLDDATRVVPHTAFCWSEKLVDLLPVLRQALLKRGLPDRLFVDNGAAFIATDLAVICASLRIALIHARPYAAESKGKIERWHRRMRQQFLSQVDFSCIRGLDDINSRLWAWVEGEYHRTPHRGLGFEGDEHATPMDRWMLHAGTLRPAPANIDEHFLVKAERLVYSDRTARLHGQVFEVPAEYVGQRIELRYDPARRRLREAYLYAGGKRLATLFPVDVHSNTSVRRAATNDEEAAPATTKATGLNYVELVHQAATAKPYGDAPEREGGPSC
jgi:transposase InsO family protein